MPFPKDEIPAIVAAVGAESIVMDSDSTRRDGIKQPRDFVDLVTLLPLDQQRMILCGTSFALVAP